MNTVHKKVRDIASRLLGSQEYVDSINTRIKAGTLSPAMETLLWHYAYGKPRDQVQLTIMDQRLEQEPTESLEDRARQVLQRITDARQKLLATTQPVPQVPKPDIQAEFVALHDESAEDVLDDMDFPPKAARVVKKQVKAVKQAKSLLGLDHVLRRETEVMSDEEMERLEELDDVGDVSDENASDVSEDESNEE